MTRVIYELSLHDVDRDEPLFLRAKRGELKGRSCVTKFGQIRKLQNAR